MSLNKLTNPPKNQAVINKINEIIDSLNDVSAPSRLIGEIVQSQTPQSDSGLHLLNGALIEGDGVYEDFVEHMAGLVSDYSEIFTTEANWQTSVTNFGVCGKFVYDSEENTIRLPKKSSASRYLIKSTKSGSNLVNIYSDGFCEQIGHFSSFTEGYYQITFDTPFSDTNYNIQVSYANAGTGYTDGIAVPCLDSAAYKSTTGFKLYGYNNAALANKDWIATGYINVSNYQAGPLYEYICIATTTKTIAQANLENIVSDLNGKADDDLSNVSSIAQSSAVAAAISAKSTVTIRDWNTSTDTSVSNLIVNKLSKAQYDAITPDSSQIYDISDQYVPFSRTINGKALSSNVTLNLSDLNVNASASELNNCKNTTSNIQTQLNSKAPATSITTKGITTLLTGTVELYPGTAIYKRTVSANTTFTFSTSNLSLTNYVEYTFKLYVDMCTTARTLTFPSSVLWSETPYINGNVNNIPDTSIAGIYLFEFSTINSGVTWLGSLRGIWKPAASS